MATNAWDRPSYYHRTSGTDQQAVIHSIACAFQPVMLNSLPGFPSIEAARADALSTPGVKRVITCPICLPMAA